MGRVVKVLVLFKHDKEFQSARPIWGASGKCNHARLLCFVSIRTPHMGRVMTKPTYRKSRDVSIRTPHMGRVMIIPRNILILQMFQSARPIWGASMQCPWRTICADSFNPHAPYGARRTPPLAVAVGAGFNPHAPYGARQALNATKSNQITVSIRTPHMGRVSSLLDRRVVTLVSIRTPHMGRVSKSIQ